MNLKIEIARKRDAEEILKIQKEAFRAEKDIYENCTINPFTQSVDSLKKEFKNKTFLKAVVEGKIVGSIRGYYLGDTAYLERMVILPDFQNKGIGKKLLKTLENRYKEKVKRFQCDTANKSPRNMYLYPKLGYKVYKTTPVRKDLEFVFMEKFTD